MMNFPKSFLKNQFSLLVMLVSLGLFWFAMQMGCKSHSGDLKLMVDRNKLKLLKRAITPIIKPGDTVFLASVETDIQQELEHAGASIYSINPNNDTDFEAQLLNWLDQRCQPKEISTEGKNYFIWTDDSDGTVQALGSVVRALHFFSSFEGAIPYQGN